MRVEMSSLLHCTRVFEFFGLWFGQVGLELWKVEVVFHRLLERLFNLCLKRSL